MTTGTATTTGREQRVAARARHAHWKRAPVCIEMSECINCDACRRACPPQFGAVFNHGIDVVVIPELCSGCGRCLPACPVDCIHDDPEPGPTREGRWRLPFTMEDPYVRAS